MQRKLINFLKSPAGKRLMIWAAPVIISFCVEFARQKGDHQKI